MTNASRLLSLLPSFLFYAVASMAADLEVGKPAPPFRLTTVTGKEISLESLHESPIAIVSFMSLGSEPSRNLAVTLGTIATKHGDNGLAVVSVAGDPPKELVEFVNAHSLRYPVCADTKGETFSTYGARDGVPLTYVVSPDGIIGDVVRGGGLASQKVLISVGEKQFARGNPQLAADVFSDALMADPNSVEARAGAAYAMLEKGNLAEAEKAFRALGKLEGTGGKVAAEGLAAVALRKGNLDEAEAQAKKAGADSAPAAIVRGEIAARGGKLELAKASFEEAGQKQAQFGWQSAMALNNLALVTRETEPEEAIRTYDQAIEKEPFLVAARSNQGAALEKAGKTAEAKKTLTAAKALAPDDELVAALLTKIERTEREKLDLERQKFTDKLVDDLAKAYKSGAATAKPADEWEPRKLVISLVDLKMELGPLARDGLDDAFLIGLTQGFEKSGRVTLVERETLDKLLQELKLGSSELADPATQLKLGKLFAASVVGLGGFQPAGGQSRLQLRLVDTETTAVRSTVQETLADPAEIGTFAEKVATTIEEKLRGEYPLKGTIASVEGEEIVVGIGKKHGAKAGQRFNVIGDEVPVEVNGKVVGTRKKTIGKLELTSVEDGFAVAKGVSGSSFAKGQRLLESKE